MVHLSRQGHMCLLRTGGLLVVGLVCHWYCYVDGCVMHEVFEMSAYGFWLGNAAAAATLRTCTTRSSHAHPWGKPFRGCVHMRWYMLGGSVYL